MKPTGIHSLLTKHTIYSAFALGLKICNSTSLMENQDGGVGRHTVPPRTTRTDRKLNGKEVQHQGDKKEHSSRMVGGAERTQVAIAGPRLAECGTNRAGSLTTSRPCGPTFAPRGPDSEWQRTGQAERWVAPCGPTFSHV